MTAETLQPCHDLPSLHYVLSAVFQGVNLLLTTWLARRVVQNGKGQAPKLPRRHGRQD